MYTHVNTNVLVVTLITHLISAGSTTTQDIWLVENLLHLLLDNRYM